MKHHCGDWGRTIIIQTPSSRTRSGISLPELKDHATIVSTALSLKYGVKPQQNIAIIGHNSIQYAIAFFAAVPLGAGVTALAPDNSSSDFSYSLSSAASQLVFVDKLAMPVVRKGCGTRSMNPRNIMVNDDTAIGYTSLATLVNEVIISYHNVITQLIITSLLLFVPFIY
ncbi:hypothetical protein K469DRAFT_685399 [Zopfia rhizophila CBS 207.26]|uniref:AMP-dependent synthetase/ligase domain-containing protein n=1 Tax=Zopfia rhizophila CBS 207.26 TaxID=1314779 RepID=A0A6A6DA22_9PEZI|nr:hypothetical protein K469DRAFT_685399 [Zopfia rhizophila CBS 207.26]